MKKILLPVITLFLIGLGLVSCKDSSITTSFDITVKKLPSYTLKEKGSWLPSSVTKGNITKIVFDYTDNLPSNLKDKLHVHIGNSNDDLIYLVEGGTVLYIFSEGIISGNNDCSNMFEGFSQLKEITFNNFDTSNVTNMSHMFVDCENLTSLNLSSFNTSKVTDMSFMFYGDCYNLTSLNLSSFNTSKVTSMNSMFYNCFNLISLDLSSFDTSNVTNMGCIFSGCLNLTSLDLSNFNTSKVTDMERMFYCCLKLTYVTFGDNFDTSNVTNMGLMFDECRRLTSLDLSSFDTSKVIDMRMMFNDCLQLTTLDLSSFNIKSTVDRPSVDTMDMFLNVRKIIPIYVREPSDWSSKFSGYNFQTKP